MLVKKNVPRWRRADLDTGSAYHLLVDAELPTIDVLLARPANVSCKPMHWRVHVAYFVRLAALPRNLAGVHSLNSHKGLLQQTFVTKSLCTGVSSL